MFAQLAVMAMLFELAVGYPQPVYRAIGHPVTWIGGLIALLDAKFNRPEMTSRRRRLAGVAALVLLVALTGAVAAAVQWLLGPDVGLVATAILASTLIAQRSLGRHVRDVADALEGNGIEAGRKAVSQIVGRDTAVLDEAGVSRAAIESLAENFSDGVTAPAFWLAVAGLPGAAVYKAVNTADSMIGHRTEKHEAFGWAAARLDDLINLPASRLTALLIVVAAWFDREADAGRAWAAVRRDARRHRSPNAGWPEAAMAGALGLSLAGPRSYGGVTVTDAEMGAGGRREATANDIRRALRLYRIADAMLIAVIGVVAAVLMLHG